MNATSLDLTGKADPLVAELLADVARAAERQRIDFFVVGAAARDLVLEHGYGMKSRRATRDAAHEDEFAAALDRLRGLSAGIEDVSGA